MITYPSSTKYSPAPAVLSAITAVGTVLSGVLPLSRYGDGKIFDLGPVFVLLLVIPAVLLIVSAATSATSHSMAGLGGGAALSVLTMLGGFSALLYKYGGELGAGAHMMTATAIAAAITVLVTLGVHSPSGPNGGHIAVLLASAVLCVGATLVPAEVSDWVSWKDWNYLGEGFDPVFALATHFLLWTPVLAALIGVIKGGRYGLLFGLGGSAIVIFVVLAAATDQVGVDDDLFSIRTVVHPLATIGAVATLLVLFIALATSSSPRSTLSLGAPPAAANPAQWAPDPFGRHQLRYWNGTDWSNEVADHGVAGVDPAVVAGTAFSAGALAQGPPTTPLVLQPMAPSTVSPLAAPLPRTHDDATVPRPAPGGPRPASLAELVLDSGQRVVLVGPLVIGRAPRAQTTEPTATLLAVDDPTMSMSATHLMVGPQPGGAWVQDIGSTNGSAVVDPFGVTTALIPGVRSTVVGGSSIRFGDRSALLLTDDKIVGG